MAAPLAVANVIRPREFTPPLPADPAAIAAKMAIDVRTPERLAGSLPFTRNDVTAGVENELQAAVAGHGEVVDLPMTIAASDVFTNICKMALAGDTAPRLKEDLEAYLQQNPDGIWENSWVHFPEECLAPHTREVFDQDLRSDKQAADSPRRADADRFRCRRNGVDHVRIPVSYLMKLALVEAAAGSRVDPMIRVEARRMMDHFISDNTSPETFSFYTPALATGYHPGSAIADETAKRLLFAHLLVMYANRRFHLASSGQKALIYMAPLPPQRQKRLNDLIPDACYRDLFMSPCLSGWNCGEAKQTYMALCHKVLSRSQLNAVSKLRNAGIITRNLVVLPNLSNISLANNGTHLSIGSRKLRRLMGDPRSGFDGRQEKWVGDLCIKIIEHFLPLFVGTYSGAPHRLDFRDLHPEKALGFLPHELCEPHLRMIWRRWKKKANLKVFGRPVTPFGPEWIDSAMGRFLRLRGDFVADFRLIDYFASVLSTRTSGALNGEPDSEGKLKHDLTSMGIFHSEMPLYLLYRLRRFEDKGFSGFEGRHYSQFEGFREDLGHAAALQVLISALAFQYIFREGIRHADIPDTPKIESERRQIFFSAAIGIPTFYIHRRSRNRFLEGLLREVPQTRFSRRYPGYIRVKLDAYRLALVRILRRDAAALTEALQMGPCLDELEARLRQPRERSAAGRLTQGILEEAGAASPLRVPAAVFNKAAEDYYRTTLRRHHMTEALDILEKDLAALDAPGTWRQGRYNRPLYHLLKGAGAGEFLARHRQAILTETASEATLAKLIHLFILTSLRDRHNAEEPTSP